MYEYVKWDKGEWTKDIVREVINACVYTFITIYLRLCIFQTILQFTSEYI